MAADRAGRSPVVAFRGFLACLRARGHNYPGDAGACIRCGAEPGAPSLAVLIQEAQEVAARTACDCNLLPCTVCNTPTDLRWYEDGRVPSCYDHGGRYPAGCKTPTDVAPVRP